MDSIWLLLATASILGQALIKQKCKLLKLLITHFDCLLRDSAAPPAVWGLLVMRGFYLGCLPESHHSNQVGVIGLYRDH